MWRCRAPTAAPRRVELDLPGQLEQQLVGYAVRRRACICGAGSIPSWSKPTLVIREEKILTPAEADPVAAGDYLYLLAPPEKAEALDRFFVDMPPTASPDPHLLGDFLVSGEITLGDIAQIYGISVDPTAAQLTLADYFDVHLDHAPKEGATPAARYHRSRRAQYQRRPGQRGRTSFARRRGEAAAVDAEWAHSRQKVGERPGRRLQGLDETLSINNSVHSRSQNRKRILRNTRQAGRISGPPNAATRPRFSITTCEASWRNSSGSWVT